ncbi:hypothetical protein [Serinicoccus sp. CNJ-927]|uniref:hypothetical protein n=1 Tax=Serinicoccus sp. CNJ-927 TaxID=1904970 RepID=UPI00117A825C|nr:hypothetical protein [Serinicoccus sp. CNJ-927]
MSGFATAAAPWWEAPVLVRLTGWALTRGSTTRQSGQQEEAPDLVPQAVRERRRRHRADKRAHQLATWPVDRLDPPRLPGPHGEDLQHRLPIRMPRLGGRRGADE